MDLPSPLQRVGQDRPAGLLGKVPAPAGNSIRIKFLAATIGTSLVALVIASTALLIYDVREYKRATVDELSTLAHVVGLASGPALKSLDSAGAEKVLQSLLGQPRVMTGVVYDGDGRELARYSATGQQATPQLVIGSDGYAAGDGTIAVAVRAREGAQTLGSVYLQARFEIGSRLSQYFGVLAAVTMGSLIIALLLSVWLRRTLTDPIVTLANAAKRVIHERDFSQRVKKTSDDELGELVESFNSMLAEVGRRSDELHEANKALAHEVSERTAAEAALREVDRRKDEFIAVLSHELRNPLSPIRNAVALLNSREQDPVSAKARDIIDRQSNQLARLIEDLMDASRISQNKMELRLDEVSLTKVAGMAIESTQALLASKKQSFTLDLPREDIMLHADAARISQVLANLLSNASKYTDAGGALELRARAQRGTVAIEVSDNGTGIPPEALGGLFQMFSQVKVHRAQAGGGLGIGLALAKGLVEMHGGRIEAFSEGLGQGSRFVVTLPASRAGEASHPRLAPLTPDMTVHPLRILVADDVPDSVDSLSALLRAYGNTVFVASDGLEALEQAGRHRPDLAVLDIGMPGLDGQEVARRIRAEPWGRGTALIALTGWGQADDKRAVFDSGFDFHMTKPTDISRLLQIVGEVAAARARGTERSAK